MNLSEATIDQLGKEYWYLIDASQNFEFEPSKNKAKKKAQKVLDEFQLRLLDGADVCIDDFKG